MTPKDLYRGHTAPLTSKRFILYIYSTNIGTEYFKHALYSPFFFSSKCSLFHNANFFGSGIIHILYTECAKIKKKKKKSGAKGLRGMRWERNMLPVFGWGICQNYNVKMFKNEIVREEFLRNKRLRINYNKAYRTAWVVKWENKQCKYVRISRMRGPQNPDVRWAVILLKNCS